MARVIECVLDDVLGCAVCYRLSANLHDRGPKCRRARRHMMSDQFEVDNKRNSAIYRELSGIVRNCYVNIVPGDEYAETQKRKRAWSLIRICRTANSQMRSMTISFPFERSPPHSSRCVTAAAVSKNDEESLTFFSSDACSRASLRKHRLFLLRSNSSST